MDAQRDYWYQQPQQQPGLSAQVDQQRADDSAVRRGQTEVSATGDQILRRAQRFRRLTAQSVQQSSNACPY